MDTPTKQRMKRWISETKAPRRGRRAIVSIGLLVLLSAILEIYGDVVISLLQRHAPGETIAWFSSEAFFDLHLKMPLVLLSWLVLFVLPGWHLLGLFGIQDTTRRMLYGFAFSLLVVSPIIGLYATANTIGAHAGEPLPEPEDFSHPITFLRLLTLALAIADAMYSRGVPLPTRTTARSVLVILLPLFLATSLIAPKMVYESLNGDGAHAYETVRLAMVRLFPCFGPEAGAVGNFPTDMTFLFAWPGASLMRYIGPVDAAARFVFLVSWAAIAAAIIVLIQTVAARAARAATSREVALVYAGLVPFGLTMAFNTTYSPYSCDLACPSGLDMLLLAMLLGFAVAFLRGDVVAIAAFGLLTQFSLPSGRILMALFAASSFIFERPRRWKSIVATAGTLAAGVAFSRYAPVVLESFGAAPFGREYDSLVSRFKLLVLTDWKRILWMVVPAGITPFLLFVHWRHATPQARVFIATSLVYFAAFYVQRTVAVHHFAPAMLLPIAAWAVQRAQVTARPILGLLTLAGAIAACFLSWPSHAGIFREAERIGYDIVDLRGEILDEEVDASTGYRSDYGSHRMAAFADIEILEKLFPSEDDPRVPDEIYGGSALVWWRYARHDEHFWAIDPTEGNPDPTYLLTADVYQPDIAFLTDRGYRTAAKRGETTLWIKSEETLARDRALRPSNPVTAPVFTVPRRRLFPGPPHPDDPYEIDLKALLARLGIRR